MEKLKQLYAQYDFNISDEEIKATVEKIIADNFDKYNTPEVWKQCFSQIDLTTLNVTDTDEKVAEMISKVNCQKEKFPDMPSVRAVCVYPALVPVVKATLETEGVNIASVSACFPSSQTFIEAKVAEVALTAGAGAGEIDVVMSVGKFISGLHTEVMDELSELKDACHGAHLKVILETGELRGAVEVKQASLIAIAAGADFIKTSTGKTARSASHEAVYVMCTAIKEYFEKSGVRIGIKPSGGISTTKEAVEYYTIVRTVLGEEWCDNRLFSFGASRLANNLLSSIYGTEEKYY